MWFKPPVGALYSLHFKFIKGIQTKIKKYLIGTLVSRTIQTESFDMLSEPVLIVGVTEESLNHTIIYSNNAFINEIGWSLEDIPDKNHWWDKAYPDPQYQKVVESLWELSMESVDPKTDSFVTLTVNIMTKHNGIKRFNVLTELESSLADGYYVVKFEEIKK
jgi:PAS domain-containing protein